MLKLFQTCKTFFLVVILSFYVLTLNGADRYSVATGNWNLTSTWSATSGGSSGASVPVAGDNVYLENGHIITVTANGTCSNIEFTGINATLTVNSGCTLTVSATILLRKQSSVSSGCTINGEGTISCTDIEVGSTLNSPSGNNNIYTFTISSDIAILNISNNLKVNSYYTGGSVKAAGNGVYYLGSGSVSIAGSVITTVESNKNEVTFSMSTGTSTGILILSGATPFNISTQGSVVSLNGTNTLVIYSRAGAQTLFNTIYRDITLSGSGTKTINNPGNITVSNLLSMEGIATLGGKSPTYGANASLQYKGSAVQTSGLEFPVTFNGSGGVIINNTNGLTLNSNRTINSLLTFINGKVTTGVNTLILGSTASVSGAATNNYVYGNLQKGIPAGTLTMTFEIGDATAYTPVILDFTGSANGGGNILMYSSSGDHPNIGTSSINPALSVNRYWTIINNGVTGFTSYNATFTFVVGDIDVGADHNSLIAGNYNAMAWSYPSVGSRSSTSTQATGLTTFGDFQLGHLLADYRTRASGNWDQNSTWEVLIGATWVAAPAYPSYANNTITIRSLHAVTVNNTITIDQLTVEPGGELKINTNINLEDGIGQDITINGTLQCVGTSTIKGPGSFILSSSANIYIGSPDGISASGLSGSIQTNSISFSNTANYNYNGILSQVTGDGLPSNVNNLTIDNLTGVSLSGPTTINGILTLVSGALSVGANTLTFQNSDTPIVRTIGTLTTSESTTISFGTSGNTGGAEFTLPPGTFSSEPILNSLTINRINAITLNEQVLSIKTSLLCNGLLNTNDNLVLMSDFASTAYIDGSGTGQVYGSVIMQRYLPSRFGYKYFSSPFQGAKVSEFSDDMTLGSYTFYRYDESRTATGWVSYNKPDSLLKLMQGYAVNLGALSTPDTVDITGIVNNGPLSVTLYNHNNTYTKGLNLIGNPYPSPIDWDAVTGWTKTNIDNAIYFFKASTSDQYGGTYSSYVNGLPTGSDLNIIPSMQGFFIHVSDVPAPYPVTGTLGMNNSVRITDLTHSFSKSKGSTTVPQIGLTAGFSDDLASADPLIIYFDEIAAPEFDRQLDALKLFNTDLSVANLYAFGADGSKLSINALPPISENLCKVPLGLKLNRTGTVVFKIRNIEESLAGMRIYLSDLVTGTEQDLFPDKEYSVSLGTGEYINRFYLNMSNLTTEISDNSQYDMLFSIYTTHGLLKAEIYSQPGVKGKLFIYNLTGQVLFIKEVYDPGHYEFDPGLKDGIYIVTYICGTGRYSKKIVIQN